MIKNAFIKGANEAINRLIQDHASKLIFPALGGAIGFSAAKKGQGLKGLGYGALQGISMPYSVELGQLLGHLGGSNLGSVGSSLTELGGGITGGITSYLALKDLFGEDWSREVFGGEEPKKEEPGELIRENELPQLTNKEVMQLYQNAEYPYWSEYYE